MAGPTSVLNCFVSTIFMSQYTSIIEGTFVDPLDGVFESRVGLRNGRIYIGVGRDGRGEFYKTGKSSMVFPGFIDGHVHFRQFDDTVPDAEGYDSGSLASLHGGATTVCAMGNTATYISDEAMFLKNKKLARNLGHNRIEIIPVLQEDMIGNIPLLRGMARHAMAWKIYTGKSTGGKYVRPEYMDALMADAKQAADEEGKDMLFLFHCENQGFIDDAERRLAGKAYPTKHCDVRPRGAEICDIIRIADMARKYDLKIQFDHVSTEIGFRYAEDFRRANNCYRISVEVAPHHLLWNRSEMERRGDDVKMNPPLRPEEDRAYLWNAVFHPKRIAVPQKCDKNKVDKRLRVSIGTDHAPHTKGSKKGPSPPSGVAGADHLGAFISHVLEDGTVDPVVIAELTSGNPAIAFGFGDRGRIEDGFLADLTEIDPQNHVRISRVYTKAGAPYPLGDDAWPEVRRVWLGSELVFDDGKPVKR